ncbi:unnamed protein product [Polarella glacialis]|uniref:Uncharacterized protein n=1 Tax=Polarella glacialis TaxID=89957 RepID=A0A813GF02_POLGL|nr:unnamed protein product [Polarella glacialis]
MAPPALRSKLLVSAILCGAVFGTCRLAFMVSPGTSLSKTGPPPSLQLRSPGLAAAPVGSGASDRVACLVGAALGVVATVSLTVTAARARASRIAAQANKGAPSLIQVLEQKRLLSAIQNLGLLSKLEAAGISLSTVEDLGLLSLAEETGILITAESLLTDSKTPLLLLAGSGALGFLTFLAVTAADPSWLLVGILGAPALALLVVGGGILALFGGATRTRELDRTDREIVFNGTSFEEKKLDESVSLIDVVQRKGLLRFIEQNKLLTLAGSLVDKPLTLTENLGILSLLESSGLLSVLESSASQKAGAVGWGLAGGASLAVAAALLYFVQGIVGIALSVPFGLTGLALIAVGVVFGLIQAPSRYTQ